MRVTTKMYVLIWIVDSLEFLFSINKKILCFRTKIFMYGKHEVVYGLII